MISEKCKQCNFRASSRRCLKAHITFVHSLEYFSCENCSIKTRTQSALEFHIDRKHYKIIEIKEHSKTLPLIQEITTPEAHEKVVHRCQKCTFCVNEEELLSIHQKFMHPIVEPMIVIKKSLNLTKGGAGGLSNPKKGQAIVCCEQILNDIVKSVIIKRDNLS